MAVLGSILFKRTLKRFLDCKDLEGAKGTALIAKLRQSAKNSLEQLIQAIPDTSGLHQGILTEICLENLEGDTEELFLNSLDADVTNVRATAASILSKTAQVNPSKLFKKLHESDVSKTEIIDILAFQRENLKPEQIITNALKLDKTHAEQLLKLAHESTIPLDLAVLRLRREKDDGDVRRRRVVPQHLRANFTPVPVPTGGSAGVRGMMTTPVGKHRFDLWG